MVRSMVNMMRLQRNINRNTAPCMYFLARFRPYQGGARKDMMVVEVVNRLCCDRALDASLGVSEPTMFRTNPVGNSPEGGCRVACYTYLLPAVLELCMLP